MDISVKTKKTYEKPKLTKLENIRDVTSGCPDWQCSVLVPPAPTP